MEIFINKRFNGPPNSGNGGYVAGLIAKEIGKCCEVKLVAPPPLEKKLLLKKSNENYELYDDETLVCIANTTTVEMIRVNLSAFQMLFLVLKMD